MTAVMPELRTVTDAELLAMYQGEDERGSRAALSEAARRDRLTLARRARAAERAEWEDGAHAQYLDAERECRGNLVSDRGIAAGVTDWSLWSGPAGRAMAYATEELRNYWDAHPRVTVTEYRRQVSDGHRVQRDERDRAAHGFSNDSREGTMSLIGGVAGTVAREGVRAGERAVRMAARQQSVAQRAQQRTAGTVAVRAPAGLVRQRQPAVDLAETLEFTDKFLEHFIVMPSWASRIQTDLWIAHNHGRDENRMPVWQYTPRLAWLSAKPGGGKSWGQKITSKLVADGKVLIEPSEAAVARKVGRQHQTVFLDEADILFGTGSRKASLRSIINAGYEPDGEWSRAKGSGEDTTDVPVFGFLGFAGLQVMRTGTGDHLNALFDRCLFNMMRKAPKGYRPPRFDDQARAVAAALSERLARAMAQEVANGIAKVVPAVPEGLGNRPAALWEPLLAVADAAGGDWPEMAREACEELESNDGLADEDDGSATLLSNYFSQLRTPALTAGGNEGEEDE